MDFSGVDCLRDTLSYCWQDRMDFIAVLSRHNDLHPIWLPYSIHSETSPSQNPSPWGKGSRNVACLICNQVSEYSAEDCRWRRARSTDQHQACMEQEVYRLVVRCGRERCAGLIEILVIAPPGLPRSAGSDFASKLAPMGILCGEGHRNTGQLNAKSPVTFEKAEKF